MNSKTFFSDVLSNQYYQQVCYNFNPHVSQYFQSILYLNTPVAHQNEGKTLIQKQEHKHDSSECRVCYQATRYLLDLSNSSIYFNAPATKVPIFSPFKTPIIFCHKNIQAASSDFNFAKLKRESIYHNKPVTFKAPSANEMNKIRMEFEKNGLTKEFLNFSEIEDNLKNIIEDHNQTLEFEPNMCSTPLRPLQQNNPYKGCDLKYQKNAAPRNAQKPKMNLLEEKNAKKFTWRKPVVLDPRLSASYDCVFPSLDKSRSQKSNKCAKPPNLEKEKSHRKAVDNFCIFCKKNNEAPRFYTGHVLMDSKRNITCPRLRRHCCQTCGASGDNAHTKKHCPKNRLKKTNATLNATN